MESEWKGAELLDSGRENGKNSKRSECTNLAAGICGDRFGGFRQTYSRGKQIYHNLNQ